MWIKVVPVVIMKGLEFEFEYTVMNMGRMYFYQKGSYQVQLELELELESGWSNCQKTIQLQLMYCAP